MPVQHDIHRLSLTSDVHNLAWGGSALVVLPDANGHKLTGIDRNGIVQPIMEQLIINGTTDKTFILAHGDTASNAGSRFFFTDGIDHEIGPLEILWCTYVEEDSFVGWLVEPIEDTIVGDLEIQGRLTSRTAQGGGWKDLITPLVPPSSGVSVPVLTQVSASAYYAPLWQVNDEMWVTWHIQHDYAIGTDLYFHVHWFSDSTSTNSVKWEFTYYYAKGHNQGNFAFGGAGTTVSAEQAAHGTAYRHMITETAPVTIADCEPDGIIACRIRRITNGGTDNPNNIFAAMADVHYQSIELHTKNRVPDFYT